MEFIKEQLPDNIVEYNNYLKILGSLSQLFSSSNIPFLNYRITENLFCFCFEAKNLARADVSADASKDYHGIGIKTFVESNGRSLQKVAEFNRLREEYKNIQNPKRTYKTNFIL